MAKILLIATILLLLQAVHSYILLTANIEDVQNVAKRLVSSPITEQVGNIVRRAYSVFSDHLGKAHPQLRTENDSQGDVVLAFKPDEKSPNTEADNADENNQIDGGDGSARRHDQEEFSSLGKSASVYLQKIKKIFENA